MERKKLKLDSDVFDQFKTDTKKDKKQSINKKELEKVAEQQGFTKREQESKTKSSYTKQFNVKCKEDMGKLITDILYQKREDNLQKQELLEQALLAYLEKNNLVDFIYKYKNLFRQQDSKIAR